MKRWLITAALLLCATCAAAQGTIYRNEVFGPTGRPVGGATIRVCDETWVGNANTDCTPLKLIYTDRALTIPKSQPFAADQFGNYSFYVDCTNRFTVQISGAGVQRTQLTDVVVPCEGGGIAPAGFFVPGNSTGLVPTPTVAPTCAVDSTSGGSFDNTTRYFRVTLLTLNGETPPSPACTITPGTCGGGACQLSVNVAGFEWYDGAIGYRAHQCADASTTTCKRRAGFPDEIDTTGPLANAHWTPGTVILSASDLTSPTALPSVNTAVIDADQVASNLAAFPGTNISAGTLQYKRNPSNGVPAQVGTTPLLLARAGTRVRGHGSASIDITAHGSTRLCNWTSLPVVTQAKIGCVETHNVNGVDVDGLNVQSTGAQQVVIRTWGSSFNEIKWRNSTFVGSGTAALSNILINGIVYYIEWDNVEFMSNYSGTGVNKGATIRYANASGANHKFKGKTRVTLNTFADFIHNTRGKTDRDRASSASFPTSVGEVKFEDLQIQWSPQAGSPQGQLLRGGALDLIILDLNQSDYQPAAGTGPFIEIGLDSDGAASSSRSLYVNTGGNLQAHTNNSDFLKNIGTEAWGNINVQRADIRRPVDLNNLSTASVELHIKSSGSTAACNSFSGGVIENAPATTAITCTYEANNGVAARKVSNYRYTGGIGWYSDAASSTNSRQWYWSATNTLSLFEGDPNGAASGEIMQFIGGKRTIFRNQSSAGILLDIDARVANDVIRVGGDLFPSATNTYSSGRSGERWSNVFSVLGNFTGAITAPTYQSTAGMTVQTTTANPILFRTNSVDRMEVSAGGHLFFSTDGVSTVGQAGANRPSIVYVQSRFDGPQFRSSNSSPSTTGLLAGVKGDSFRVRNAADTVDITVVGHDSVSDVISLGPNASGVKLGDNSNTATVRGVLTATTVLDFGNIAAIGCSDLTVTVTGAALGDTVSIGVPNGSVPNSNSIFWGWVSASDTVTVRHCSLASGDSASGTFRVTVIKF